MRPDSILPDISTRMNIGGWAAWLDDEQDPGQVDTLWQHTRTGRPLGGEAFLDLLESILARPVRPRTPGRTFDEPRKIRKLSRGSNPVMAAI